MKEKESNGAARKVFALFAGVLNAVFAAPVFAAEPDLVPQGLTDLGNGLAHIFTSDLMKAFFVIIIAGAGAAFAFNKDNEKMKAGMVAVMIGGGIMLVASTFVDKLFTIAP